MVKPRESEDQERQVERWNCWFWQTWTWAGKQTWKLIPSQVEILRGGSKELQPQDRVEPDFLVLIAACPLWGLVFIQSSTWISSLLPVNTFLYFSSWSPSVPLLSIKDSQSAHSILYFFLLFWDHLELNRNLARTFFRLSYLQICCRSDTTTLEYFSMYLLHARAFSHIAMI